MRITTDLPRFKIHQVQLMLTLLLLAMSIFLPVMAHAEVSGGKATSAPDSSLKLELVSDVVQVPWGIAVLPDGALLVTERSGKLFFLDQEGAARQIAGLPDIWSEGQGGLLDVVVHPDFEQVPWVYFSYSKPVGNGSHTAIARAKLYGEILTNWEDLYIGSDPTRKTQHFGSRLVLHDGYLFFTIGDRGNRDVNPQDLSRDGGKVYRLHDDGRVPKDNPFVGDAKALSAVWSYGHRNPQGLVFEKSTGQLWLHEHGPRGGDELNLIKAGANYGWPLATYGINYWGTSITDDKTLQGTQAPAWHWTPSIAPSGMAVVNNTRYPSLGSGLLVGSLKFGELHLAQPQADGSATMRVVMSDLGRVRSLVSATDGTVYVGITGSGVFRLQP